MFLNGAHSAEHTAAKWNASHAHGPAASLGGNGYLYTSLEGRNRLTHRAIWKIVFNTEPEQIDHINGIRDDNRLVNLRAVERNANAKNMARPRHNTSGALGVSYRADRGIWRAYIRIDGRHTNLGHFATFEDALAAREAASARHGYHANHGREPISPLADQSLP